MVDLQEIEIQVNASTEVTLRELRDRQLKDAAENTGQCHRYPERP